MAVTGSIRRHDGPAWELDRQGLLRLGACLDQEEPRGSGKTFGSYLAESLLKVRDREGVTRQLIANPAQVAFERRRRRVNIVLKARQMGMTTWIAGRYFLRTITQCGVLTVQVAHTREAAESIFALVERMWENLPPRLRHGDLARSRANVCQMVFPALDSEFRVVSAADPNAGRGLTIQNLHLSEVARWPGDAQETLAGLRAALAPGGEMTLESTPQGACGTFYEEWMGADESGLARHFFPWWMEPAYVANAVTDLRRDECDLMRQHGLSPEQIGFRRGLEKNFRRLREQEFAEDAVSCFKASGECCFDVDAIASRLLQVPAVLERRRGGALLVWLPALAGKQYLIGVDSAGGGADGDFAAIQVIELATGLQCAELRERLGTLELARVAAALAKEFNGAMIAVERNNHGAGVLAYLDGVERYANVYEQSGVAGWLTSAGSKPCMVSRMGALLAEQPEVFSSPRLLQECRTFLSGKGGKMGAAGGSHDDCLMAMAVAQAVRAERLGRR